jgi:hypothetical protein
MDVHHRAVFLIAASSIDPIHPTVAQALARSLALPPPRFTTRHRSTTGAPPDTTKGAPAAADAPFGW